MLRGLQFYSASDILKECPFKSSFSVGQEPWADKVLRIERNFREIQQIKENVFELVFVTKSLRSI